MTGTRTAEILRHLESDAATDGELLLQFIRGDDGAFERIVRRHGPAVLDVCRRITRQEQDAEDAFQAVFLILAQKAVVIRSHDSLGYWLYGVALRVSQRARRSAKRRRTHEMQGVDVPERFAWPEEQNSDLAQVVHEELMRLPSHYREVIVICDLQGLSRTDAAKTLSVPEGTVSSRLAGGRKKLAARLTRRGVVLSATTIPTILGSGSAIASVPEALVSKTCAVAAGWRSRAMIPLSVLRLTQGGIAMRRMLLLGMTCLALTAAGAIYAAQQVEPYKPDEPRPNVERAAAKAEPVAVADEPKAEEKTEGLGAPQLRRAFDVSLNSIQDAIWSPDGNQLAIAGNVEQNQGANMVFSMTEGGKSDPAFRSLPREPSERLVGFTPNSKRVITEVREYDLASGFHKLTFWEPAKDDPDHMRSTGTVNLQPERSDFHVFAQNGKSYRTVVSEKRTIRTTIAPAPGRPATGEREHERDIIAKLTVREVSAETGKTIRTVQIIQGEFDSFQLSRDGNRLAVGQTDGVAIYSLPSGKKVFASLKPQPKKNRGRIEGIGGNPEIPPAPGDVAPMAAPDPVNNDPPGELSVEISPNGNVVLANRWSETPILVNGVTGKTLPPLEDTESATIYERHGVSFSSDGRLMAAGGYRVVRGKNVSFVNVWDSQTGKLLKSWPILGFTVAFHPTKPILALLEPNEKKTRLGFWDFSAEVAEEK